MPPSPGGEKSLGGITGGGDPRLLNLFGAAPKRKKLLIKPPGGVKGETARGKTKPHLWGPFWEPGGNEERAISRLQPIWRRQCHLGRREKNTLRGVKQTQGDFCCWGSHILGPHKKGRLWGIYGGAHIWGCTQKEVMGDVIVHPFWGKNPEAFWGCVEKPFPPQFGGATTTGETVWAR